MSANDNQHGDSRTFHFSSIPSCGLGIRYFWCALLVVALLHLQVIDFLEKSFAQDSPQWRRTKDGWVDMRHELQAIQNNSPPDFNSTWSNIWPTAATLCIGLTAYWLLTVENTSDFRRNSRKFFEKSLGHFFRQSTLFSSKNKRENAIALGPIGMTSPEAKLNQPHH